MIRRLWAAIVLMPAVVFIPIGAICYGISRLLMPICDALMRYADNQIDIADRRATRATGRGKK